MTLYSSISYNKHHGDYNIYRAEYINTARYVLVIAPLGGMLLVYRPDTRGRVAPEGGGSINRQHTDWGC